MNVRDALNVIIKLVETKDELTKTQEGLIKQLEAENKKLRAIKCPPISDGDSCICPIEELETTIKNACDLINDEGKVSKWNILNILNQAPKGK